MFLPALFFLHSLVSCAAWCYRYVHVYFNKKSVLELESDLLPSEDESSTASDDSRSHTSLEEVDRLDPNMLLYKVHVTIR